MAINLNHSILEHKKDVLLDPAYTGALERGMVMVASGFNSAGERLVRPSAAGAGERVVGILFLSETNQAQVPVIETLTVPAAGPYTVTLRERPANLAAGIRAYNATSGATIVIVDGAPGAGQLGLAASPSKVVTADAALASVEFKIVYEFNITPAELARRGGRRSVNQGGEGLYEQVTIAYGQCVVYTSCFKPQALLDVDSNVIIASGADGDIVLTGGAGTDFGRKAQEPIMLLSPGIEQAFVGVECNLPG